MKKNKNNWYQLIIIVIVTTIVLLILNRVSPKSFLQTTRQLFTLFGMVGLTYLLSKLKISRVKQWWLSFLVLFAYLSMMLFFDTSYASFLSLSITILIVAMMAFITSFITYVSSQKKTPKG